MLNHVDLDYFSSRRTLITGGAGFIGSWLCDTLILAGAEVHCADNLSTGIPANIQHLFNVSKFVFRESDVTQPSLGDKEYDFIAHFASRASPDDYQQHPIQTLEANSQGTRNMLELCRKNDAVLLYASTSEIYGDATVVPTPEEYWGNVNPIGLRSCYDEGKRFGEALCMAYHRAHGLDVRIVRIFNTYGPRLRPDGLYGRAVSKFIDSALTNRQITIYGKGDHTRSFCYVTDTIAGIVRAAIQGRMKGEVVNIGGQREITVLELAEKIKTLTSSKSKITFLPEQSDDPRRRCPDITKAKQILGWAPIVTLEDGLRETINWFNQRRPSPP